MRNSIGTAHLAIAVFSDEKLVKEATQHMRQALVNNSAGLADSLRVGIAKRERTETGVLDGLNFSRFRWSGSTQNQIAVSGLVYGAICDESIITINAIALGADDKPVKLAETSIATFNKQ